MFTNAIKVAVVMATLVASQFPFPAAADLSRSFSGDEKDEMTGSRNIYVGIAADRKTGYSFPYSEAKPNIVVRCDNNEFDMYFNFGASIEHTRGNVVFLVKFGDESPVSITGSRSSDNKAVFVTNPLAVANKLASVKTVIARSATILGGNDVTFFIDNIPLKSFNRELTKVKEACGL